MRRRLLGIFAIVWLGGCGYHAADQGYHWESVYRPGIKTVAVPIFQSTDYHRGVEFSLTKAVINDLEARTPYKVAPRERADTILEGQIVEVRVSTISEDFNAAIPQEQVVGVIVNFTWKDLHTGKILVERRGFEQASTYYPTLGEGRFVGKQNAAERLATAIVQELQADW